MKLHWPLFLFFLTIFLFGLVAPVRADGIIIPPRPPCPGPLCPPCPDPADRCPPLPRPMAQLEIRYHHVTVNIQDQLAVTHVDQVFYNPNDWAVEGTYIFPLPKEAAVTNFTLWVDGKPVSGQVLSAEEARSVYEETVKALRDPALLEYEGRGAVKASIFPIPPQGERRIELEYTQVLTAENGLVRYSYPLNTEKFSRRALEDVSVRVEIRDKQAIRAVYSPSHSIGLDRQDDHHVIAGYEAQNVLPDQDYVLYYSLGEEQAFHLFSYRNPADPTDPDGFFMLLLAPKPGSSSAPISKDVLLVLDRSGSMDGVKFRQAQEAVRSILKKLNPGDHFYLESFSTGLDSYASELRPAEDANEASAWVDRLSAGGSTDINRALLDAIAVMDRERPTYLIFLTDGLPTEGVTDTQEILNNVARAAPKNLRLFAFGVGDDVDTVLLDSLSQQHHGLSTYVRSGDALDEILSSFYQRISTPVLTDLSIDFGTLVVYDIYPTPLPDLFSGSQVVVVGRYRAGGSPDVTLTGMVDGREETFQYAQQVFADDSRDDAQNLDLIPRLWATRKIGYLLNQVRIQGPDKETIQQIVKLSIRYGIVTPYTSYLVTEQMPLGAEAQNDIANQTFDQAQAAPAETTGKSAVDRAAQEGQLQGAQVAPPASGGMGGGQPGSDTGQEGSTIRVVGTRTFIYQEGAWIDTAYDPQAMSPQKIVFLSPEYYQLLSARQDVAQALALGEQVTLVVDGQAYQVVGEGEATGPVILPTAAPTALPTETMAPAETRAPQPTQKTATLAPTDIPGKASKRTSPCTAGLVPILFISALFFTLRSNVKNRN
jgi:Ca-activated chloride channel homolog